MDAKEGDDEDNESFLSNHTIAMRKAWRACRSLLGPDDRVWAGPCEEAVILLRQRQQQEPDTLPPSNHRLFNDVRRHRQQILQTYRKIGGDSMRTIPSVQAHEAPDFQRRFQQGNQPCRILGLSGNAFAWVHQEWQSPQRFRRWIRQVALSERPLGDEDENVENDGSRGLLLLPVRRPPAVGATALDAQGRSNECSTVSMPLAQWIDYLDNAAAVANVDVADESSTTSPTNGDSLDYLKDFHFEAWLETIEHVCHQSSTTSSSSTTTNTPAESGLYQLPKVFQCDLLNPFLRAFTKGGDYRFLYWGPARSRTDWHSDVLHSFSWSYNVFGRKEWIFQIPQVEPQRHVRIVQEAGECIFVPAMWKHQVTNLEETLSINRNWITAANVDLCWDCLTTEMRSIEEELSAWSNTGASYDWEARESMLRGCVGLDVTAFYLMVLYRLGIIVASAESGIQQDGTSDTAFETVRLIETLQTMCRDESLHLEQRIAATLADSEAARQAVQLGKTICKSIPSLL